MSERKQLAVGTDIWVVLRPQAFENMLFENSGIEMRPGEEPYYYMPVFLSYEAALAWESGDPANIRQARTK